MPVMYSWISGWESGLQTNRKLPPVARTASQVGWREVQIVAEIDRVEPGVLGAVFGQPALHRAGLAILLLGAVLR